MVLINPHLDFPGTFTSCSDRYTLYLPLADRMYIHINGIKNSFLKKSGHLKTYPLVLFKVVDARNYIFNDYLINYSWDFCSDRAIFLPAIKLRKQCGPFRN